MCVCVCVCVSLTHGVIVGPIGSKLSDRFGCRAVTMTGGILLCIGFVLCSLATKLFHVYLALGIVAGMNIHVQNSHNLLKASYAHTCIEYRGMVVGIINYELNNVLHPMAVISAISGTNATGQSPHKIIFPLRDF